MNRLSNRPKWAVLLIFLGLGTIAHYAALAVFFAGRFLYAALTG
jgi:hypothetical protein